MEKWIMQYKHVLSQFGAEFDVNKNLRMLEGAEFISTHNKGVLSEILPVANLCLENNDIRLLNIYDCASYCLHSYDDNKSVYANSGVHVIGDHRSSTAFGVLGEISCFSETFDLCGEDERVKPMRISVNYFDVISRLPLQDYSSFHRFINPHEDDYLEEVINEFCTGLAARFKA